VRKLYEMPEEDKLSLDRRLAAQIVGAYLRNHQVPADQLGSLISTVRQTLGGLAKPAAEAVVERTPAVSIRQSITPNFVVCLDCGYRGQMLRRHLTTAHGLAVDEYRVRWNLKPDHPITAPGYSERRSAMAKQIGLGQWGASAEIATVPETETATQPAPKRRGRPRSAPTASV
jgi:predicted transcriptional regulator